MSDEKVEYKTKSARSMITLFKEANHESTDFVRVPKKGLAELVAQMDICEGCMPTYPYGRTQKELDILYILIRAIVLCAIKDES